MLLTAIKEALGLVRRPEPSHVQLPNEELYATVAQFTRQQIKDDYKHDPWNQNFFLNCWEYVTAQEVLESYPWNVSLPFADLCNARCTFCDSWLRGEGVMKLDEIERFVEVLRHARLIGIQGHGEPLANPHIQPILSRIIDVIDPRAEAYIITNGVYLGSNLDLLLRARVRVFNISLNGTTEATHQKVMGLGEKAFRSIISTIRKLIEIRDRRNVPLRVSISMVLTADNFHEARDFVRLGHDLRVNLIQLRTLMPIAPPPDARNWNDATWETATLMPTGLNYHLLPPYLHPQFKTFAEQLRTEIARSSIPIEAYPDTWERPIFSPEVALHLEEKKPKIVMREEAIADRTIRSAYKSSVKEVRGRGEFLYDVGDEGPNPYDRRPRFNCRFVYHNLNCTELSYRLIPCCYMADVPGFKPVVFDGKVDFFDYWNSPAFVSLRRRLRNGPLFPACKTCPNQG